MKISKYLSLVAISLVLLISSCQQSYQPGKNIEELPEGKIDVPEIEALLRFIDNSGDYINKSDVPNLVSAEDVFSNLNRYFVIDIRNKQDYIDGHISGAAHVEPHNLMTFLEEKVAASVYDKLVIVCSNGQASAYVTGVLRLIGYSNAYSMSFGMSSWNSSIDKWSSKISSKYISQLERKTNPVEGMHDYPPINTGETCGAEISDARGWTLLNTPFQKLKISADRAFKELDKFYIIAYMSKEMYDVGHIPGAYNYIPHQDIRKETLLNTIPANNQKILVYDYTGQTSGFLVAYLRLLGYNAFTMPMGMNSFMYNTLSIRNANAFKAADIVNDFPLVKGENPTDKEFEKELNSASTSVKPKKIVQRKKKEVAGGCS
jgi:rhodanese-related sulfurtransferase